DQAMLRLLDLAEHHDAKDLRVLGRRILDVVDPQRADAEEEKQLRKDEAKAAQTMRLTMSDDGHGRVYGRFTLPVAQGAMLKKILLASQHRSTWPPPRAERGSGSPTPCAWAGRSPR
ncbi:MAG: HNH endonuclease signature motif containing protein, partial [Nocardioides sp.]